MDLMSSTGKRAYRHLAVIQITLTTHEKARQHRSQRFWAYVMGFPVQRAQLAIWERLTKRQGCVLIKG
jgi:hypothetical protein